MSSAANMKVATTYFPIQPNDIRMYEVVTEPTPLRIIKFDKYLQKWAINILRNREALGLLGAVVADADYKSVNKNQIWIAPTDPGTSPVLPTASAKVAPTRPASKKPTEDMNRLLQHQHDVYQHKKEKTK